MKKIILLALLAASPARADYGFIEIGVGHNTTLDGGQKWENAGTFACTIGAGYTMDRPEYSVEAGWWHYSQCMAGEPFGPHDEESALDHFGVKYRWKF